VDPENRIHQFREKETGDGTEEQIFARVGGGANRHNSVARWVSPRSMEAMHCSTNEKALVCSEGFFIG
jgi:hypothetical protein